jgi:murein DD-endopeptidase MepM/ murein hydrolase activator NlpD
VFPRIALTCVLVSALVGSTQAQVAFDRHTRTAAIALSKLADGFDFPVGNADGQGYHKARGFRPNGHPGEDWDGSGGGNSDLNDAVNSIGAGVVVFARDVHLGWGNVVIVRHNYREDGVVKTIDALYGHLNTVLVVRGERVARGQQIGSIGTAHGRYAAHLHFEIRKNIEIGINRAAFPCDTSCYYDPTKFIVSHRHLDSDANTYPVALNTFTRDGAYNFDNERDFESPDGAPPRLKTNGGLKLKRSSPVVY